MSTTINDVAKAAGVSKSTVSLVLNNRPTVSEDTKAAVLRVIKELNYRPLKAAQAITTKKTRNIGLMEIITTHDNPEKLASKYGTSTMIPTFAADVARGIEEQAQMEGYGLLFTTYYGIPTSSFKNLPPMIENHWIDGLLLVGGTFNEGFTKMLSKWKIPFVLVGSHLSSNSANCVFADNAGGAIQAVEYLIGLGYSRIGFINGPPSTQTSFDKMQGYLSALQKHGIEFNKKLVDAGDFSAESGYEAMNRLLERNKDLQAVFVGFDGMSIGAEKAISERGLKIPEDISMVGFEDSWIATHFDPPLTTVKIFKYEIGIAATRILFDLMAGKSLGKPQKVMIPTELVIRQSCNRHETHY
jgi:LacI family transcriptional regulator